jgi:hypothetical protein
MKKIIALMLLLSLSTLNIFSNKSPLSDLSESDIDVMIHNLLMLKRSRQLVSMAIKNKKSQILMPIYFCIGGLIASKILPRLITKNKSFIEKACLILSYGCFGFSIIRLIQNFPQKAWYIAPAAILVSAPMIYKKIRKK